MTKINPTNDLAFKKVFASNENKAVLKGLIKDFFNFEPDDIIISNPYDIKVYREMIRNEEMFLLRQTVADISASLITADFTAEMQVRKEKYYDERALYYPFTRYCAKYGASEDGAIFYSRLQPIYSLNILGYTHFNDDDALRIFTLYDPERHKRYNKDLIKIGFFELTKKQVETKNQQLWLNYFKGEPVPGDAPDYILQAAQIINYANMGEEEKTMLDQIEYWQSIWDSIIERAVDDGREESRAEGLAEGLEKGLEKGRTKGITEGRNQVVKRLLLKMDMHQVAEITDMSISELESLIKE